MGIAATVFSCQRERSSLASLLDDAETRGDITANETDQLDKADLILTADDQSEHLLAEISIKLHQHDIDRAATQARLLAKPTGQPVATLVTATADQNHPTLGQAIAQLAPAANTILVSAPSQEEPAPTAANTILVSAPSDHDPNTAANTKMVSAEPQDEDSKPPANTKMVSAQPQLGTREYQFGTRTGSD